MTIKIGNRLIGKDKPCFIIAEAGINHNGNLKIAKKLVDVSVDANADSIKFQTFKESELHYKNITYEDTLEIKEYCDNKNIIFLSTPHSFSAIEFLDAIVPAYKIASPHIIKHKFVKKISSKGKPMIASTGSIHNVLKKATYDEINQFLRIVDNKNLILLYCISKYPFDYFLEYDFINFRNTYSRFYIGYSSHSKNIEFSLNAVKLGACVIEQHITINDNYNCPDKDVSLNPKKLKQLVMKIRKNE